MLDWWQSLTDDNQIKLLIVFITALLGGFGYWLKKLFDKKQTSTVQSITISGDTNTQTTHGGIAVQYTGTGAVTIIWITLEQHEASLKHREAEVKAELQQAQTNERQILDIELKTIQQQLQNSTTSYEARITSLKQRITQLETLRGNIPDAILEQATAALAQGESQLADQLFKQIEDEANSVIQVAAEAAYQRSQIAKDAIRYTEAFTHAEKAVRLMPDNALYLNGTGELAQILGAYQQAKAYYEQALATFELTLGTEHPSTKTVRNNLLSAREKMNTSKN